MVQKTAELAHAAAGQMGVSLRMTEGNTCYRGGKPGVSDVFAATLWAADYALLLASNNYTGVNFHGGTGPSQANSVGGFLPGDVLLKEQGATPEQIASHPHPFYTPIATFGSEYVLEPVAYGLKFASAFCGAKFFKTDLTAKLQATGANATAYAARLAGGQRSVIVLNKDADNDLELRLDFGADIPGPASIERLQATSLESRAAFIHPQAKPPLLKNGKIDLLVPRASGLCLTIG
jgi:hypothetical protein